ncbi:VOC family protein [Rhodococcus erythropolis]|uniref:VOC family protein n=1 Tax=Rhodococcus erythropolis TaxID=1833 RepID=UPI002949298E|nr:VOC family protein [Rhodococcus erythropolis]MDV6275111.1 VOC family protein [Rhodococcus erythropolis]
MTEPIARLRRLRSVELRTTACADSVEFYSEVWGLRVVESGGDRAWLRGTGDQHHAVQLTAADRNGLGRITFAVGTPREVDEAARRLEARGIAIVGGPGPVDAVGGGYGLQFVDLEGRIIELLADTLAVAKIETGDAVPTGVTHVVLNTVDIDAAVEFYSDVLGMRVSDWSEHQMAFMRCNSDHHSIAFNQAQWTAVNHVAYEMSTVDNFMRGIGRLRHHGVLPLWGPGKHGPGDNTFSYFGDPAGLVCEYTSGIAQVDEDRWLCKVWRRVPELSDLWGTAGPPSAEVRERMAGIADPGAFERFPVLASRSARS